MCFVFLNALFFSNKRLANHCWYFIDENAKDVLDAEEFSTIDHSILVKLIESNTLKIREVELFKAVDYWAEKEWERQNLKTEGPAKRQILKENVVNQVWFPVMTKCAFDVAIYSKILTQDEELNILKYSI